jgi:diadenosine tetraphosphate (Ap4A) HIT family hydrolase
MPKGAAMTDDCNICNPSADALVYRGDDGLIILDDPIRAGHVLVASRTHGESLHDISPEDAAAMFALANRAASAIVAHLGVVKVYVAAIGDKDKHFHVHLLPKSADDANLGPYVFGADGWASTLDAEVKPADVEAVSSALRSLLG